MKTLIFSLLLTLSMTTLAGQEGGGGDPFEILAQDFEKDKIIQAKEFLETKLNAVKLPNSFDDKVLSEIDSLIDHNKVKVLPAIILIGAQNNIGNYNPPQDVDKFLSLGGMTSLHKGAPIYFAERVNSYSLEKLSSLLLHEILHHVLESELNFDEDFIEALVSEIMSGKISLKTKTALLKGYYFTSSNVHAAQFLKAMNLDEVFKSSLGVDQMQRWKIRFMKRIGSNLKDVAVVDIIKNLTDASGLENLLLSGLTQKIESIATEINPDSTLGKNYPWGCRSNLTSWSGYWSQCRGNELTLGEVLSAR